MKKISLEEFKNIDSYMYNKTRDVELACFNYHFYDDERIMVTHALSMYQNRDGGFGLGLEPDNNCRESSAIATQFALRLLVMSDFDKNNLDELTKSMIDRAFKYIFEKCPKKDHYLYPIHEKTNDYPHAPWWTYSVDMTNEWKNNPGCGIYALALHFLSNKTNYYKKAIEEIKIAIDEYLTGDYVQKDTLKCYVEVYNSLCENNLDYKNSELKTKIIENIKDILSPCDTWNGNYPTTLLNITNDISFFDSELKEILEVNLDFLIDSRTSIGAWDINWNWDGTFEEEFEVARIKYAGFLTLENTIILNKFGRLVK